MGHTPIIDGSRTKLEILLSTCSMCSRKMLNISSKTVRNLRGLTPYYYDDNLHAQLERANIAFRGDVKDKHDDYICEDCDKAGKSTFICALCGEERSSELKQERFGDPPEFLCTPCYETVPAKTWEKKERELSASHRWDFE